MTPDVFQVMLAGSMTTCTVEPLRKNYRVTFATGDILTIGRDVMYKGHSVWGNPQAAAFAAANALQALPMHRQQNLLTWAGRKGANTGNLKWLKKRCEEAGVPELYAHYHPREETAV